MGPYPRPGGEPDAGAAAKRQTVTIVPLLPHRRTRRRPWDLHLGLDLVPRGGRLTFHHTPYDQRSDEAKADYDRLLADIRRRGVLRPVIVFEDHVLIGQRRTEIANYLALPKLECLEILADLTAEPTADRIVELSRYYGTVTY